MALRLRKVESLAKELNTTPDSVITMLSNKGVATVDGYYDSALFDALLKTPVISAKQRLDWGVSHRLGIGAVKHILDPLGVRITIHDCKGAQYLMLKKGGIHRYVKWQYSNYAGKKTRSCIFPVRGFMLDAKFEHYLFTCFDGPFAWAISRQEMIKNYGLLTGGKEVTGFTLQKGLEDHVGGALSLRLHLDTSKFELKLPKQLGF